MFSLVNAEGLISYRIVRITATVKLNSIIFRHEVLKAFPPAFDAAIGATEIADQRLASKPPAYWQEEMAHWMRITDNSERMRYKAKRLVELTIEHLPGNSTVGGTVNSLELSRAGIVWITQSSYCQGK
jgi:hypothetical protein